MKKFSVALILFFLFQGVSYGEEPGTDNKFEMMRGKMLEHIGKRRDLLKEFESCLRSAKSPEDLRSCKKKNKMRMQELQAERKGAREKMKEKREKRRKKEG